MKRCDSTIVIFGFNLENVSSNVGKIGETIDLSTGAVGRSHKFVLTRDTGSKI